ARTAGFTLVIFCPPFDRIVALQFLFPSESVSNDGGEIIVLWCPPEHRASAFGSCNDPCWIARSARCDLDLEVDAGNALDHFNHLTHRETMAVAAIQRHRGATGT